MRALPTSKNRKKTFWTIRQDSLEAVKMEAVVKGKEKIEINGRWENTIKIEIHPAGFFSSFWHAHYWFRPADLVFVQYRGVHGLPGTPATTVSLKN
ncbi:MAG TPA: hypothetical protein ENK96_04460 [Desulfobulbaceae bacterium]|nr:hypothetical protein [Desulfobulbaceae bacterium]